MAIIIAKIIAFFNRLGYYVAMSYKYSKTEIADRVYWTNNLRIAFGLVFFASLAVMNILRVDLSLQGLILCVIGGFALFYGLMTFFFLKSSKPILAELIFLTAFLGLLDLAVLTAFIYFSGGYQSPYYSFYIMALAALAVASPYFPQAVFFWTAAAVLFYETTVFLTVVRVLPYFSPSAGLVRYQQFDLAAVLSNALIIPAMLVFFAFGAFIILKYLEAEKQRLQDKAEQATGLEKKIVAVSAVYWVLTHVFNQETMLGRALDKLLEALGLTSGMILLANPKRGMTCKAKKGIPPKIAEVFRDQSVSELSDPHFNFVGIVMDGEFINHWSIKKLVFNQKTIGFLVLFGKEGEPWLDPQLDDCLNAVADEIAAAIYYGKFVKPLKPQAK